MTKSGKKKTAKRVLRLPDLDFAKRAVLNTLGSPQSKRAYAFAIDDFVAWYCSEPRLAFSKTVVLRYRLELEGRRLSPATINLRLAAVRRLAYEAADTGLLSPELAAGIRRVSQTACITSRISELGLYPTDRIPGRNGCGCQSADGRRAKCGQMGWGAAHFPDFAGPVRRFAVSPAECRAQFPVHRHQPHAPLCG